MKPETDREIPGYIDTVAEEIQNAFPGIKGFNRRGLYRMKKFYETYADDEFVATLLSQIHHLAIISKGKHLKNVILYNSLYKRKLFGTGIVPSDRQWIL